MLFKWTAEITSESVLICHSLRSGITEIPLTHRKTPVSVIHVQGIHNCYVLARQSPTVSHYLLYITLDKRYR